MLFLVVFKREIVSHLFGMTQEVAAFAAQDDNGIPTAIEMIFGNDALHSKATMNAFLMVRADHIQLSVGLKKGQFVKQIFGTAGITLECPYIHVH